MMSSNLSTRTNKIRTFLWVVAQMAEHRTVTAAIEGSTPFDPPKALLISNCKLPLGGRRNRLMPGL
jgi:hypothetical protein